MKTLEHNWSYEHQNLTYRTQVNEFSVLNEDELTNQLYTYGLKSFKNGTNYRDIEINPRVVIPDEVDWRYTFGPVKHQSYCGSCWAFTTSGVVNSLYYRKYKERRDFSIQQQLDCTRYNNKYLNYGCQGGWPDRSFEYIKQVGLTDATNYPYLARVCFK